MQRWTYFLHLVGWTAPIFAAQWLLVRPILRQNFREVLLASLIGTVFFSAIDSFAVRSAIWFFDPKQILGIFVGPLPIEEVLFFFLTSLLVSQSLVVLLPVGYRR
jgi:lycopene cyclase domain-containing protein